MDSQFDLYDIVSILNYNPQLQEIHGCEGVIVAKSQHEKTREWLYSVSIAKDQGMVWSILEKDLARTGKKAEPENFKTKISLKIPKAND